VTAGASVDDLSLMEFTEVMKILEYSTPELPPSTTETTATVAGGVRAPSPIEFIGTPVIHPEDVSAHVAFQNFYFYKLRVHYCLFRLIFKAGL